MKHSKVVPLFTLINENFSIVQAAELLINFYKNLSEFEPYYNYINIISEKTPLYHTIDIQMSNSVLILSEEILHQNIDDIRKVDKVDEPDINYCRDGIITICLETKIKDETLITLNYTFNIHRPSIGSIVVNEECFNTFLKAKTFLAVVEKSFPLEYSVIKISDRTLNKIARSYKAPLGWITYFSNSYEITIPDDLKGVEYEYSDKGKYLILTREDIALDIESLESGKQKLVELMEQISIKHPVYSKSFTPPK